MSTKRILTSYIGTVRGLQSHIAAQMYPGKVVSLEQYKKKKPPLQRRPGVKDKRNLSLLILPDNLA